MSFNLPTLDDLGATLRASVPTFFTKARADFWPNNLVIIAKVVALGCYEAMLRARWIYRQVFISTCTEAHLEVHGAELGVPRRPPLAARGNVTFSTAGSAIKAGALVMADTGAFYVVQSTVLPAGAGSVVVPVVAQAAGVAGNLPPGLGARLVTPVPGVTDGVFLAGVGGGAGLEAVEAYRARVLARLRSRPRGGNADDYVAWVTASGNFDAVFVKAWEPGAGNVTIWPLHPGTGAARIPTIPALEALAEKIEALRPLCASPIIAQAAPRVINIAIAGLGGDTEATRREIMAELADMFDERAMVALPGPVTSFSRSWINEAISRAAGEDRHILTVPASDVVLVAGEYPVLGTVSYV